jgi:hypothetical protein
MNDKQLLEAARICDIAILKLLQTFNYDVILLTSVLIARLKRLNLDCQTEEDYDRVLRALITEDITRPAKDAEYTAAKTILDKIRGTEPRSGEK